MSFLRSVARMFGDSNVDQTSAERQKIWATSELLSWRSYDTEERIFHLIDGYGIMLEVPTISGGAVDFGARLQKLLGIDLPDGMIVQVMNWASPNISKDLMKWWAVRRQTGGVAQRMAENRVAFLEKGRYSSIVNPIVLPHVRRVFITARFDGAYDLRHGEALAAYRRQIETVFRDQGGVLDVTPQMLLEVGAELLHTRRHPGDTAMKYSPFEPMHTQLGGASIKVRDDSISFAGDPGISATCATLRRFPSQFAFHIGSLLNGVPDNAESRPRGPVLSTMTVKGISGDKARATALRKVTSLDHTLKGAMGRFMPGGAMVLEEWKRVQADLDANEKLLDICWTVVAYASDEDAPSEMARDELISIFRTQNIGLGDDYYLHLPLFLGALPFGASGATMSDLSQLSRVRRCLSETAGHLAPVHGDWSGHHSPYGVGLFSRTGQYFQWDPYSSETNYNVAVSGQSGSGKSVLLQEIAASLVCAGGRAIVVDDGRSFENTASALGGDFIIFDSGKPISINPFSLMSLAAMESDGGDIYKAETLAATTSIAITICTGGSETGLTPIEREMVAEAVSHAWDQKQTAADFTDVMERLQEKGAQEPRAKDLASMFRKFAKGGELAAYFTGQSQINIEKNLTVFELGGIKSNPLLKAIVLQVIMFVGSELMFKSDRSERVGLVIDEAWDLLKGGEMGAFIEGIARRARKHTGMLVAGTQSLNDFYANAAAKAVIDNSAWVIALAQNPEAIENLRAEARLNVTEFVTTQLKTLKKHDGAFSELAIRNSEGGWVFARLVLDPYSIAVYSSRGSTVQQIKALTDAGVPLEDAIQKLVDSGAAV